MSVDTKRQADRRKLRFTTPDPMFADAEAIVASERAGTLRRSGNWTAGQIFNHLATFINFAYEGYPRKPPLIVKWIFGLKKNAYIHGGLPAGQRIPNVEGGTWGTQELPLDDGYAKFKAAWARLLAGTPAVPSPIFGKLRHEEWIQMHLRHAELHLSFLHPGGKA